ncbi:MAG: zinc-ribbon domain-containing protein [Myxococcota bacterium]|nr:zinc-ribbon domain-containing protein [Myxococcota bacterium]
MAEFVADDPKLAPLWDTAQNPQPANKVDARSFRPAVWRCAIGHSFQRSPRAMQNDLSCPTCSKGANTHTNLGKLRPGLASLWDTEKNGGIAFATLDATHANPVWWRCPSDHRFQRPPVRMLADDACPTCGLEKTSLAALAPNVAAEWHPTRNAIAPMEIRADHVMNAWWVCPNGHEYQATVRARTQGNRQCSTCYGGWSLESIRAFVKSLVGHLDKLNPSELFALAMQAGVLKDKGKPFVMALTNGRFPVEELEKFANGQPSIVDKFAAGAVDPLTLELVDKAQGGLKAPAPIDPYALPAAPDGIHDDTGATVDVSKQVDTATLEAGAKSGDPDGDDLPLIETRDALDALDKVLIANADAETVAFLLDSAKAKLWRHAYVEPEVAKAQATGFQGDTYSSIVRDRFLAEFTEADALQLPAGYSFRPGGPEASIVQPNLMQRRVAVCVRAQRRFGNWSGMGAGKTLSAILATRVVDAGLTVICCPNAVVENWAIEITGTFPNAEVQTKTWEPTWRDPMGKAPRYLVMNFEQFQLADSEESLVGFVDRNVVDFIVIDEIHYAKQRDAGKLMSKRKRLVQGMVLEAGKKNADLCVLGMSGTPVINNLQEGKSLVEMITGHRHDDLDVVPTVQNCMRLYQRLVTLGTRWKPEYKIQLDIHRIEVDCGPELDRIRAIGRGTVLQLEQVLTELRLPVILDHIKPGEKVLIYTHYVDGIVATLRDALLKAGLRVGMLTGETDDTGLKAFLDKDGAVDVLIASSRVGTGVNGLQYVCQKLIINALPWTNAEYEQLVGRLFRQGSRFDKVEVIIPVTFATVNGQRWSYCESKLHRLEYKKSIADAAVDGVVPEGNLRTPAQAQQDVMDWLSRLETGQMSEVARTVIKIPLDGTPSDVERRVQRYGDFSKMNNRWYMSDSTKTHDRLANNPEEWAHYHTLYRQLRETWPVVPYKEEIRWLSEREGRVVGDFGCGEALIATEAGSNHTIHSFDHVAIDKRVIACDIAHVPLEDESLDVAIFCLSLMGSNFTDYIHEAHRCLVLDGALHIWEAASYFEDAKKFASALGKLGFDVTAPTVEGAFVRIYAHKNNKKVDAKLVLPFRGAA